MAYINLIMYSKVLPTYKSKDQKEEEKGEVVTTSNPTSWNETLMKLKNG